MTQLYLIAHKVRGGATFDVATRMTCPICHGGGKFEDEGTFEAEDCGECNGLGYWWIIPTSGWRAYPYWFCPFTELGCLDQSWPLVEERYIPLDDPRFPVMPDGLPDHFPTREAPRVDILGLFKAPPKPTIPRRI